MNNNIFQYNGTDITFLSGNGDIMVNATQLAKPYGKRPNDYLSLPATSQLIKAITRKYGSDENQLVRTVNGGSNPGTWMHRLIVLDYCQWLDIDLKLWCTEKLDELMRFGITATQPTLEAIVSNPDIIIGLAQKLKEEREHKARLQSENERLRPEAELMDKVMDSDQKIDIGQAAKILQLPFGRNTLFQKLREKGIFFSNRNEPKQDYVTRGYFELKEKWIDRNEHDGFMVVKVLVTQKGLEFIARMFEAVKPAKKLAPIQ